MISEKLKPFGTTIFSEMTALAQQRNTEQLQYLITALEKGLSRK